jgi:hypothetical protein
MTGDDLWELVTGLHDNGLLGTLHSIALHCTAAAYRPHSPHSAPAPPSTTHCHPSTHSGYTHLLTGYIGTVSFLESVLRVLDAARAEQPDTFYLCDPVMGDNGRLYVPEELIPIYRDSVIGRADLITPNQARLICLAVCHTFTGHRC